MEAALTDSSALKLAPNMSTQFFTDCNQLTIHGSHLMNVSGDVNIYPPPLQPARAEAHPTTRKTQYTTSGNYCSQLLHEGRGFPLVWKTRCFHRDVGRVTAEGVFDFFFNIYLPADHPINDNDVPDNFSPLTVYDSKSVLSLDYVPEDFVLTPDSVRRIDLPSSTMGFEDFLFEGSGSRGATLAIPFGSHVEKLGKSLEQIVEYVTANAESWYKYVNGERGCQLPNGSLYLITGWEKARAWGMASFQNAAAQSPFRLAFQPVFDGNMGAYKYQWTASGPARTRTSGQIPAEDTPLNQTIFIHGFSISLGTGIWGKLFKGVEISQIVDSQAGQANRDYIPFGSQGFSPSWSFGFLPGGGSSGGKQYGREDPASTDAVKISDLAVVQNFFHPSQVINNYMLQKFPNAAAVISHDDDWRDVLRADSTDIHADQDLIVLLQRACRDFSFVEENGLVTIRENGGSYGTAVSRLVESLGTLSFTEDKEPFLAEFSRLREVTVPKMVPCQYRIVGKARGKGTYAIVREAIHITTDERFTCKIINKKLIKGREYLIRNEIAALKRISSHANIVSLRDYFETADSIYLCFDLCTGGELIDRIFLKGSYYEFEAAALARTIFTAINHIHAANIVHRDLKPENLLFRTRADADIMIADFGLSHIIEDGKVDELVAICGTSVVYLAPEILLGRPQGKPVDIWAMGVVTYCLLAGYTPFDGETPEAAKLAIINGVYSFTPEEYWANVSETARDFVRACLSVDPALRPTAEQALQHKWLANSVQESAGSDPAVKKAAADAKLQWMSLGLQLPNEKAVAAAESENESGIV